VCSNDYPEQKVILVSLAESFTALGAAFGPVIGALLYAFFGYAGTFYSFGALSLFSSLFMFCFYQDKSVDANGELK
jgi:MFS family permease